MDAQAQTQSSVTGGVGRTGKDAIGGAVRPQGSKSFATVSNTSLDTEKERLASAQAMYTGGEQYIEKPEDEFVHLHVAFEGLGIHDPDIVSPTCREPVSYS